MEHILNTFDSWLSAMRSLKVLYQGKFIAYQGQRYKHILIF